MNKPKPDDINALPLLERLDTEALLHEIHQRLSTAQKKASMAAQSVDFSPIEEAGQRIRAERKKQRLTLNELCDLSGIAYATLNKIEQGHSSARLDSLGNVAHALGMKLWIG
ncbi:MAG: helix-turn-helix transcriptional regulator [Gammaproteobacteria bacterium]|nr:helix-turn-helix transcriptional regulator [Gammaproteobacteria bacterium]MBQ0841286.1 helix-turn-helix transcriptional regulator [Gammaproteobacteria bacterium]